MISSMTAYSSYCLESKGILYQVDIKTLNSKYFDIFIKSNYPLKELELEVVSTIKKKVVRGRVEVHVDIKDTSSNKYKLDSEYVDEQIRLYEKLKKQVGSKSDIDESFLTKLFFANGAVNESLESKISRSAIKKATSGSVNLLYKMREEEGKNLLVDLVKQISRFEKLIGQIESLSKTETKKQSKLLRDKLNVLLKDESLEEKTVLKKIGQIVNKVDVNEELVRLGSHIDLFRKCFSTSAQGKKMDFILQEMLREVNTIGAKTSSSKISKKVIECKSIIEKLKEQSFNVE